MDIEYMPKMRQGKDRASVFEKMMFKIEESIKAKRRANIEAMSQEELKDNLFIEILPEIPKTKKGVDKAIEEFIKDMRPEEDNGEELLEFLGFYDIGEGIEEGDWTKRANYLRERIKFKEEGDTITILSSTKEVVNVVIEYLQSLPTEDLFSLHIFGYVTTQEDANRYKETYIDQAKYWYMEKLLWYSKERYNSEAKDTEEDILYKAGERLYKEDLKYIDTHYIFLKDKTDQENIEEYKERIRKAITDYPEEAMAYYKGLRMLEINYSDRAVLSTLDKLLNNGTTTN